MCFYFSVVNPQGCNCWLKGCKEVLNTCAKSLYHFPLWPTVCENSSFSKSSSVLSFPPSAILRGLWCHLTVGSLVSWLVGWVCLAAPGLHAHVRTLSCGMWDLAAWPGIKPGPPYTVSSESEPPSHQESLSLWFKCAFLRCLKMLSIFSYAYWPFGKGNPLTLLVGMQTSTAAMENNVEIS